jgi:tetratricopeptide (TPR) repeat protein
MKYSIVFLLCIVCLSGFAQQLDYKKWKKEASKDIRLLPEYGNVAKTKEQKKADDILIEETLTQEGTRKKGSDHLIKLGFNYLYQGDIKTAMYRFNQAYLLDSTNENIYWGYGAIYHAFGDDPAALFQYDKGLAINPKNSAILTDKATIYFVNFQQEKGKDKSKLTTAIGLLNHSYDIDPKNESTVYKLSICYFLNNDCDNATKYYNACMQLGGKQISADYAAALNNNCKGK